MPKEGASGSSVDQLPHVGGAVTFFYYDDLPAAVRWYEETLGFPKVLDDGWVVIFKLAAGGYFGLVNGTDGCQRPLGSAERGAILAIETEALAAWFERLSERGVATTHGIVAGAKGKTDEFRVLDPGGYTIEFFQWRTRPEAWDR